MGGGTWEKNDVRELYNGTGGAGGAGVPCGVGVEGLGGGGVAQLVVGGRLGGGAWEKPRMMSGGL